MVNGLPGRLLLGLLVASIATISIADTTVDPTTTIRFEKGAESFTESLPLGNGRMGFMVFGGVVQERIVLNEESMWSGSPFDDDRPEAYKNLPEIRQLLLEGKNNEAEVLVNKTFTCQGVGSNHAQGANVPFGCYQTLGNLWLIFDGSKTETKHYGRALDLRDAVADLRYELEGVEYRRQFFISEPDQVGVIRLTADKSGALSFNIRMDRPERFKTKSVGDNELLMTGQLDNGQGGGGVSYAARLRAVLKGGKVTADGEQLTINGADEALLLFAAETDYSGNTPRERRVTDPAAKTAEVLTRAAGKPYRELLADHVADHRNFFDRVSIVLGDGDAVSHRNAQLPTDQRVTAFKRSGKDPALAALYFNYGRYLLIASSRPGTLPANLQGLWAEEIQTPWNADWHLDINVQMNYWPAELANLSDCHQPMLALIESLQKPGARTAKAYYNADGWVAHVITNCWGFTAPGEVASWGSTTSGSAWLCEHPWEHYAYTGDREYLKWAYPILKGSARFYLDMLIEEPNHGWLVTAPSNSPENSFRMKNGTVAHTCMGPTVDMQLLRELFGNCIRAAEILGKDEPFLRELGTARARLAPNQVSPDGRLQEWLEPYEEPEPKHRHVSHMYGLYPYDELTSLHSPVLADAAKKSLERRGYEGDVGWSNAWKVCLWARLLDADQAFGYLRRLIGHNGFPNLFNACWPGKVFQIEGNFGGAAGIAEMLLQSHGEQIQLLPVLPGAWPHGRVTGLRARGGYEVDIAWKEGKLTAATLKSLLGNPATIRYGEKTIQLDTQPGRTYQLAEQLRPCPAESGNHEN